MYKFKEEVYDEEEFTGLVCADMDLSNLVFRDCLFVECDFSGSKFGRSQFSGCDFKRCNFSNAKLYDTKLSEVNFNACKLAGIYFSDCNQLLFSINLVGCKAAYCNFQGMDMKGSRFAESDLSDCVFEGADLKRTDFSKSELKGADFSRANLESADFRGAMEYQIDPQITRVMKAKFNYPDVLSLLKSFNVIVE